MKIKVMLTVLLAISLQTMAQKKISNWKEGIKLETNYDLYLTGESVHFVLSCHLNDSPSTLSKVVYLELVDSTGTSTIQLIRDLSEGLTISSFFLPSTIATGNYALVAYTNWMKNEPSTFFTKCISIINPYESIPSEIFSDSLSIQTSGPIGNQATSFTNIPNKVDGLDTVGFSITQNSTNDKKLFLSIKRNDDRNKYVAPLIEAYGLNEAQLNESVHLPELHGHLLAGVITDKSGNRLEAPISLTNRAYSHAPRFSKSDENGNFNFVISAAERIGKLRFKSVSNSKIEFKSPFIRNYGSLLIPKLTIPSSLKDWILERAQRIQIDDDFFSNKYVLSTQELRGGLLDLWDSKTYYLDDYKRFPKVEDPIIEYIPEASFKIQNNKKRFTLPEFLYRGAGDSTLVLLNDIPVSFKTIFSQNASYIEKITIYPEYIAINNYEFMGIIHFETFERFEDKIVFEDVFSVDYSIPSYLPIELKNSTLPDYSDVLLWKEIESDWPLSEYKIKTSLADGEYEVLLQEIDGKILGKDTFFVN